MCTFRVLRLLAADDAMALDDDITSSHRTRCCSTCCRRTRRRRTRCRCTCHRRTCHRRTCHRCTGRRHTNSCHTRLPCWCPASRHPIAVIKPLMLPRLCLVKCCASHEGRRNNECALNNMCENLHYKCIYRTIVKCQTNNVVFRITRASDSAQSDKRLMQPVLPYVPKGRPWDKAWQRGRAVLGAGICLRVRAGSHKGHGR